MSISYFPPAEAVESDEPTGSGGIIQFLEPGARLGRGILQPGYGGVEIFGGSILVGDWRALAALGHALVMRFDPPSFDEVEAAGVCTNLFRPHQSNLFWPHHGRFQLLLAPPATCWFFSSVRSWAGATGAKRSSPSGANSGSSKHAGLCGTGTDGTGPYNWPDVARAALRRPPIVVWVAETSTAHFDWLGTGTTEDQARDSLMRAWHEHAAITGADPDLVRRDELNVRHGVIGTGWRDVHPFPPPRP